MQRLTTFPLCMLLFGFAVVIGFGQPATAQDETADEPNTEQAANTDDAAPSPSDAGSRPVPPPAPETAPEGEAPRPKAAVPPVPAEGSLDGETAEAAAVAPNERCDVTVDEAIPDARPAPVCCQPAPVCCQPAPTWCYPPQHTRRSSRGFLHRLMCR